MFSGAVCAKCLILQILKIVGWGELAKRNLNSGYNGTVTWT